MTAKELMIGDFVYIYAFPNDNPKQEDYRCARITGINSDEGDDNPIPFCEGRMLDTNGIFSRPIDTIEPIPLTEEILKVNGFIVNTQQAYLIDGIFLDTGLDGNAYWWQIGHCPICAINYVHELQHALRLGGFYDLADNFKIEKDKQWQY